MNGGGNQLVPELPFAASPTPVVCSEGLMLSIHNIKPQASHVTALFRDGAQSFFLREGATLAELAGQINVLGIRHEGAPIAIHVQFDTPSSRSLRAGQHGQLGLLRP